MAINQWLICATWDSSSVTQFCNLEQVSNNLAMWQISSDSNLTFLEQIRPQQYHDGWEEDKNTKIEPYGELRHLWSLYSVS